mmetsp:Transcript_45193/g.130913  ORF Transcript_45193/g.130913 Transcript_45193/m.130913 type:complete len:580 (-) Transcript_45193:104-1843(-)
MAAAKKAKAKPAPAPKAKAPPAAKAKAKPDATAAATAGRGKRKATDEPPKQSLLKWFTPKATAAPDADSQDTPADARDSGTGGAGEVGSATPGSTALPLSADETTAVPSAAGQGVVEKEAALSGRPDVKEEPGQPVNDDRIHAERQDFSDVWSSDKFGREPCDWFSAYSKFYAFRLKRLRPSVEAQARTAWPSATFLPALRGCTRSNWRTEVALIGVLFKHMKSRPNIALLYRDSKAIGGSLLPEAERVGPGSLCSESDVIWLEDGTMRLELVMPTEWCAQLPTGIVGAVRGKVTCDGRFNVKYLSLAKIPPPPPIVHDAPALVDNASPPFMALVSGLLLGASGCEDVAAARSRAVDFLVQSRHIRRLIVCGGLLAREVSSGGLESAGMKAALDEADAFLAQLAAVLPVDVMPGPHDPTNLSLPQFPLHPYLFKKVRTCRNFKSVTNPYECSLRGGFRILGHSGQPVEDLMRCTRIASPIQALQVSLEAMHLAPTAPDSLPAQPCTSGDPFIVDAVPHVLFSGGHEKAEHRWYAPTQTGAGTMCVCIPAFHVSPQVVLVNLHVPSDVHVLHFGQSSVRM